MLKKGDYFGSNGFIHLMNIYGVPIPYMPPY